MNPISLLCECHESHCLGFFCIDFVTILLLVYVLFFWPPDLWHLTSPTREWSHSPCIRRRSLYPWSSRQVPTVSRTLRDTLFTHSYPPSLIFSVRFHSKEEYPDHLKSPQMNILSEGQMCLNTLNKTESSYLHRKRNMLLMRTLKQKGKVKWSAPEKTRLRREMHIALHFAAGLWSIFSYCTQWQ